MKKITSLLAALLLTCGLSWAQTTIDWTAADQGYANAQEIESIEFDDNVSASFNKGSNSNAPKYYNAGSAIRCYGGNYFTITSVDGNLQNITLSFATGEGSNAITTDNGNYENGTWTGDATSVTFTIGGTSGHRRIAAFAITYGGDGPAVAMPTFSPEGGTYEEAQTVTISCETENVDIFYTLDGTTPDDESIYYSGPITIEETTTIKAIAYDSEDNASVVAVATYTIIDPNAPGSVNNPYTVAQARAAIDAGTGTQNVYATGIVSAIPTAYSNQYNNITFNMVDEEGDEEFLQAYRCGGDEAADVQIGDVVVVYGTLTLYNNSTYEFAQGCQVVSLTHPVITEPVITLSPATVNVEAGEAEGALTMTYINMGDEPLFEVMYFEADGETEAECDWIIAEVDGDQVEYLIEANEGEARTAYLKVYGTDGNSDVYSNLVTISQEAYVAPFEGATYTMADAIESGRHYIIVGFNGENAYAMGGQNNNNRAAVAININEGVAEVESADVYEFVINGPDANGFYTIYDAAVPGYLYAASNSSNYLRTREFNIDENSQWTIEFDEENGFADITAQGDYTRNWLRFNKNGNGLFACYASGQQDIYLYVKDDDTYEYYVDVKGYAGNAGNWCLIAAPIDNVDPANVTHMIEPNDFDLYFFDQSFEAEWRNYKTQTFNLEAGKGYLYANYENVTLKFEGEPCESDGVVYLDYDESASCKGFNLVGNPFTYAATIDYDFYIMNEAGTELEIAERELVNPFEGVFVQAEGEDEVLVFAAPTSGTGGSGFGGGGSFKLNLRVSNNEGKGDFARVRFGEGNGLEKFMLNPANTKLYFPMGGNDYAAICAANIGEMPLNFKAATEGTYTLSANWGEMEMDYLHLIDNLTGADVDLLATPSYSFDATMSDNAARFTLQFATTTGIEENQAEEFAFFSNGTLIVSNEGNATLQVIDMTGRIVSSQTINGSASVSLNATSGVYVLRLVNGDNAKVQKIVVK